MDNQDYLGPVKWYLARVSETTVTDATEKQHIEELIKTLDRFAQAKDREIEFLQQQIDLLHTQRKEKEAKERAGRELYLQLKRDGVRKSERNSRYLEFMGHISRGKGLSSKSEKMLLQVWDEMRERPGTTACEALTQTLSYFDWHFSNIESMRDHLQKKGAKRLPSRC